MFGDLDFEKNLINFLPILVTLYVKSRFFFITRDVQLDNGVDLPGESLHISNVPCIYPTQKLVTSRFTLDSSRMTPTTLFWVCQN